MPVADATPVAEEPSPAAEPTTDEAAAVTSPERRLKDPGEARRSPRSGSNKSSPTERAQAPQVAMSVSGTHGFVATREARARRRWTAHRLAIRKVRRAAARDSEPDAPSPPEKAPDTRGPVSSCEAAIARNNEQLEIGAGARARRHHPAMPTPASCKTAATCRPCSLPERTRLRNLRRGERRPSRRHHGGEQPCQPVAQRLRQKRRGSSQIPAKSAARRHAHALRRVHR